VTLDSPECSFASYIVQTQQVRAATTTSHMSNGRARGADRKCKAVAVANTGRERAVRDRIFNVIRCASDRPANIHAEFTNARTLLYEFQESVCVCVWSGGSAAGCFRGTARPSASRSVAETFTPMSAAAAAAPKPRLSSVGVDAAETAGC